jgi:hypothetical protein
MVAEPQGPSLIGWVDIADMLRGLLHRKSLSCSMLCPRCSHVQERGTWQACRTSCSLSLSFPMAPTTMLYVAMQLALLPWPLAELHQKHPRLPANMLLLMVRWAAPAAATLIAP